MTALIGRFPPDNQAQFDSKDPTLRLSEEFITEKQRRSIHPLSFDGLEELGLAYTSEFDHPDGMQCLYARYQGILKPEQFLQTVTQSLERGSDHFVIARAEDGSIAGYAQLARADRYRDMELDRYEIAVMVFHGHQHNGHGRAMMISLLESALNDQRIDRITMTIKPSNIASLRLKASISKLLSSHGIEHDVQHIDGWESYEVDIRNLRKTLMLYSHIRDPIYS